MAMEGGPIKATESPALVDFKAFVSKAMADPMLHGQ